MVSIGFVRFPWFLCGFHGFYNASPVSMVSMVSIGFVRFPWFLWFLCGAHGFYNASPVSMLSMACVVSMRLGWFAVSMFSIVCLRFLWFPWSVYFLCGFYGFHAFSIILADSMVFIYVCEFYACYFSWCIVVVLDAQWYSSFGWYMHFPGILRLLFERMQLTLMSATKKT